MTKKLIKILIALLVALAVAVGVLFYTSTNKPTEPEAEPDIVEVQDDAVSYVEYIEEYKTNKAINDDYVGRIVFDSGLIDLPFVKGVTNDTYLRTTWDTGVYDIYGSIFMDSDNILSDQNIVIYGHYAYSYLDPSRTAMFTPLEQLIEKENYEANKIFKIYLEKEVRTYQIVSVYYCPLIEYEGYWTTKTENAYYVDNFDAEFFNTYKQAVLDLQFYDTGVDFTISDSYITLQTCVENREDLREIVIAKQIDVTSYE